MPKIQRDNDLENSKHVENNLSMNETSQTSKLSGNLSRIIISMFIFGMGSLFFYFLLSRWLMRTKEQEQIEDKVSLVDEAKVLITPGARQLESQSMAINLQTNAEINYRPVGPEFIVPNSVANWTDPRIVALDDGGFVTTFSRGKLFEGPGLNGIGIYLKMYAANGTELGQEDRIDSHPEYPKKELPEITRLQDDSFIVAWQSLDQDGSAYGAFAQRFDKNGKKFGDELQLNVYTIENQAFPSVSGLQDGGFVAVWESCNQDKIPGYGIYARRYTHQSVPVSNDEFRVGNGAGTSYPQIIGFERGGFAIVWAISLIPFRNSNDEPGIYARLYSSDGKAIGDVFRVNDYPYKNYRRVEIALLKDDAFVITWTGYIDDVHHNIYAKRYKFNGEVIAPGEIRVNTREDGQSLARIAGLDDGGFIITWQSDASIYQPEQWGIYAQRFTADGRAIGSTNEVITKDYTLTPAVTSLKDGGYIIVWGTRFITPDDNITVRAQRYEAYLLPTVTPTPTYTPTTTDVPTTTAIPTSTVKPTPTVTPTTTLVPKSTATPTTTLAPTMTPTVTPTAEPKPNPENNTMQMLLISATGAVIAIAVLGGVGTGIYLCKRTNQYSRGINEEAELDEEDLTIGDNFSNRQPLANILTCCGLFKLSGRSSQRDRHHLLQDINDETNTNRSIATVTNASF